MCVLTSHSRQGEASFQTDTHTRTHIHTAAEGEAAFQHRHTNTHHHAWRWEAWGALSCSRQAGWRMVIVGGENGGALEEGGGAVMARSQCSSELSTSPFSSSQPPVCVTQLLQPCWLAFNPFPARVTEVTLGSSPSAVQRHILVYGPACPTSPLSQRSGKTKKNSRNGLHTYHSE